MAFSESIHGDVATGECEEGLKDMVKGACWGIFRDSHLREKYLMNTFDGNEDDFKKWIAELDESREIINGVKLILTAWREMSDMS